MPRSKSPLLILTAMIAFTAVLGFLLLRAQNAPRSSIASPRNAEPQSLLLYCAAGVKNPVSKIAEQYEKECGVRVDIQFGGSGTLLANLKLAGRGDLYLPADSSYIDIARQQSLVDEVLPLAKMTPVIAVPKGNPAHIAGAADLLRPGLRLALANPDAASIGKTTKLLFTKSGIWADLEAAANDRGVFKPTVNDIANDVRLGVVDAAIVWDSTVRQQDYAGLIEAVPIDGAEAFAAETPISVLHITTNFAAALRFARYLAAPDKGQKIFAANGFAPATTQPSL
jgi:molybdenum ABC transporter molybdate-binding protein